jgi:hypothetical protein
VFATVPRHRFLPLAPRIAGEPEAVHHYAKGMGKDPQDTGDAKSGDNPKHSVEDDKATGKSTPPRRGLRSLVPCAHGLAGAVSHCLPEQISRGHVVPTGAAQVPIEGAIRPERTSKRDFSPERIHFLVSERRYRTHQESYQRRRACRRGSA